MRRDSTRTNRLRAQHPVVVQVLANLGDRVALRIDAVRAPAPASRRIDVLREVVEEQDLPGWQPNKALELGVNRRIRLGKAKKMRGEVPVEARDARVLRRPGEGRNAVVVDQPNPVRVIRVREARGRDPSVTNRLDQRKRPREFFAAARVVNTLGVVGRVRAVEQARDARRPVVERDAPPIKKRGKRTTFLLDLVRRLIARDETSGTTRLEPGPADPDEDPTEVEANEPNGVGERSQSFSRSRRCIPSSASGCTQREPSGPDSPCQSR
jgi:hypothetical protein